MPCVRGCCLEEVKVEERGDNWVIRRRLDFRPLPEFTQPEPEYPDILVTPGQDPNDPTHIVPVEVVYPKKYGSLNDILEEVVPNMRKKEDTCEICARARQFLQSVAERRN